MDYDTMRELVPVFCMNPRLHDEALLSIPIGQAWRYLRDNEFDVLDSQTVLYRHKGYGGHWFLREPFQDSEFNEFRIVPGKSVKLRVLEDRRADTLVATKEISVVRTDSKNANSTIATITAPSRSASRPWVWTPMCKRAWMRSWRFWMPKKGRCRRSLWARRWPNANPGFVRVVRTTPPPACPKARALWRALAAISCRFGWTAPPPALPKWAAKACLGSGSSLL